jgi:hypothetical protein
LRNKKAFIKIVVAEGDPAFIALTVERLRAEGQPVYLTIAEE